MSKLKLHLGTRGLIGLAIYSTFLIAGTFMLATLYMSPQRFARTVEIGGYRSTSFINRELIGEDTFEGISVVEDSHGRVVGRTEYHDGVQDGVQIKYYPSGDIAELSHWKHGVEHGAYYRYDELGRPVQSGKYADGVLIPESINGWTHDWDVLTPYQQRLRATNSPRRPTKP